MNAARSAFSRNLGWSEANLRKEMTGESHLLGE